MLRLERILKKPESKLKKPKKHVEEKLAQLEANLNSLEQILLDTYEDNLTRLKRGEIEKIELVMWTEGEIGVIYHYAKRYLKDGFDFFFNLLWRHGRIKRTAKHIHLIETLHKGKRKSFACRYKRAQKVEFDILPRLKKALRQAYERKKPIADFHRDKRKEIRSIYHFACENIEDGFDALFGLAFQDEKIRKTARYYSKILPYDLKGRERTSFERYKSAQALESKYLPKLKEILIKAYEKKKPISNFEGDNRTIRIYCFAHNNIKGRFDTLFELAFQDKDVRKTARYYSKILPYDPKGRERTSFERYKLAQALESKYLPRLKETLIKAHKEKKPIINFARDERTMALYQLAFKDIKGGFKTLLKLASSEYRGFRRLVSAVHG